MVRLVWLRNTTTIAKSGVFSLIQQVVQQKTLVVRGLDTGVGRVFSKSARFCV